ncbi:hypothetical protein [Streptomyces griseus]|uniref:hypothetical protein n=1 Tax=Streptomyces griseus TaxID=1911 RepID=UPI000A9E4C14|nr:hypothetical protein [Streptomyces griseus]
MPVGAEEAWTDADDLAAWRLDAHGDAVGRPLRFGYDLTGIVPGSQSGMGSA